MASCPGGDLQRGQLKHHLSPTCSSVSAIKKSKLHQLCRLWLAVHPHHWNAAIPWHPLVVHGRSNVALHSELILP